MVLSGDKSLLRLSATAGLILKLAVMTSFHSTAADCITNGTAILTLVMQSRRNATGHHITKVSLQSRTMPGSRDSDLGKVEASQAVRLCDGEEVVDTWATVTASPPRLRPEGYEVFPGLGYYKFHTHSVTWNEAYLICVKENSHILVLNSEAEANVVKQFLNRKSTVEGATWAGWAWSGYHDRGLEGDYRTVYGGPLNETGYTKWHPAQPDNKPWGTEPDQDCGSFSKDALLNDLPCLAKLPFICEQPL